MNRLKNVVASLAASERSAEQAFVTDRGVGATTAHLPHPGKQPSRTSRTTQIRSARIDNLVDTDQVRPSHIFKLDVEGQEGQVLVGARKAILASKSVIVANTHSHPRSGRDPGRPETAWVFLPAVGASRRSFSWLGQFRVRGKLPAEISR